MSPRLYEDAVLESVINSSGFADEISEPQEFAQINIKIRLQFVYTLCLNLYLFYYKTDCSSMKLIWKAYRRDSFMPYEVGFIALKQDRSRAPYRHPCPVLEVTAHAGYSH